jgi:maleate isomerase
MPYNDQLSRLVADFIEHEGIEVQDFGNLSVTDNAAVGCIAPEMIQGALGGLSWRNADLIVLSACVQTPSLGLIEKVEQQTGISTTSAAVCTAKSPLRAIRIGAVAPGLGAFFSSSKPAVVAL